MAFNLGLMRLSHAQSAYQRHARIQGLPVRAIRDTHCRRSQAGTWELLDAHHRIVAHVRADGVVTVVEESH